MNAGITITSGGHTGQLQPLDVLSNKLFQTCVPEEWNDWMAKPNQNTNATGCMKRPTISEVWVKSSWEAMKKELTIVI